MINTTAARKPSRARVLSIGRASVSAQLTRITALAILAIAASLAMRTARAANGLCTADTQCSGGQSIGKQRQLSDLTAALAATNMGYAVPQRAELSDQESFSFSGVGALVCSVNGSPRVATAFLVGAFDLGVTVAHPFEENGVWAQPEHCVYTTTDSTGQVRERIPVAAFKAQWQAEDGAYGATSKDFAVVRLSRPSNFAQRTMPLGRFSGNVASVLMIGFSTVDADTLKRKTQGTVYSRNSSGILGRAAGFTHDMDCHGIASGAPVVDERSGVIIGVHTQVSALEDATQHSVARNTMITMNEWLEKALRVEMDTAATAANTTGK